MSSDWLTSSGKALAADKKRLNELKEQHAAAVSTGFALLTYLILSGSSSNLNRIVSMIGDLLSPANDSVASRTSSPGESCRCLEINTGLLTNHLAKMKNTVNHMLLSSAIFSSCL